MRRLCALYLNEMTKISHKLSVIIMLFIMAALVFGIGGLMLFSLKMSTANNIQNNNDTWQTQNNQQQLQNYKTQLADIQAKEKTAGADLANLQMQEQSLKNQIDMFQYAADNNINMNSQEYRAVAMQKLFTYKDTVSQLKSYPAEMLTDKQKKEITTDQDYITRLQKVIDNKDYAAYIVISNEIVSNNSDLTDDQKQIEKDMNALRLKINPTGETNNSIYGVDNTEQLISQISSNKYSLLNNFGYVSGSQTAKSLTTTDREKLSNDIVVNTYKLENGMVKVDNASAIRNSAQVTMMSFGLIMMVILMMILAGGCVSSEISTGSIKSLIIAPVRRWKILFAKFLSLLTVLIVSGLFLYGISILAYGIFFGFNTVTPYVFASGGTPHVMNYYLFFLAKIFVNLLPVLFYMVLAFMLSVVTRNTAASVGISIAVFFAGSIVSSLITAFAKGEWVKFLPFSNMDVTGRVFPYDTTLAMLGGTTAGAVSTTIAFSLITIAVFLLLMGYTAFDSFTRRDIS